MTVTPVRVMAAMYAARKFADQAEWVLKGTAIGLKAEELDRDTVRCLELLEERLRELRG